MLSNSAVARVHLWLTLTCLRSLTRGSLGIRRFLAEPPVESPINQLNASKQRTRMTGQRSNQLNYDPAFVCFGLAETLVTTGDSTHSTVSPVSSTSTKYNHFRRFMDSMDSKQNRPTWLGLTRASRSQPNLLDCNRFRLGARESCSSCFLLLNRPLLPQAVLRT